jgi:hypothetical protein
MRSSLFRSSMQCRLVDCYWRFGTTYWSHLPRSGSLWPLKMLLILRSEILVTNYHPCCVKSQERENLICQVVPDWTMLTDTYMIFALHIHFFPALCAVGSLKWMSMWPSGCNESCFLKMGQYSSTPFIHHSFCCLTYDRTIASTKVSSLYSAIVLLPLSISSILSFP